MGGAMGSFYFQQFKIAILFSFFVISLQSCINPDNEVIDGLGTPDVTQCGSIPGVADGALYTPRDAVELALDARKHPDIFYIGWSKLDTRSDLRFPAKGYDANGFEDKLLVSRKMADDTTRHWQLLPLKDNNCNDIEKVRIHSFDVAPNGRSLYLSMARTPLSGSGRDSHLAIYRYDLKHFTLTKISTVSDTHFMYPTYIGNDPDTKHEMLVIAKTVTADDIPINYRKRSTLKDEYDRDATPLIHKMDAHTGETWRIGFNNSHQTEPFVTTGADGNRIAVFTQWEHQDSVNRFALWKIQIDGSDEFTFFGQESSTDKSGANLFQGRVIQSGPYKDYILMTQGNRSGKHFPTEGNIAMTLRHHQDIRSDKATLKSVLRVGSTDTSISRSPEHYNEESFVYSYREDSGQSYQLYVKDYPETASQASSTEKGEQLTPDTNEYHFVQARSFYPPTQEIVAPTDGKDLGENRVSFTNENLQGKSGFLVSNLLASQNGVQHQLDGVKAEDISLRFFIPSHHFDDSNTISLKNSPEMSIPASGYIPTESDGSIGVVLKNGLYVWKVNKRFEHNGENLWIPVRSERQEISFVPNRVNACNQCHQERDQANVDKYTDYPSLAAQKMKGDLTNVTDISSYDASESIPDFHKNIMPLFTQASKKGGASCASCHFAGTKLNLSNATGPEAMNSTFRALALGASSISGETLAFTNSSINPMGMDNNYHPAPLIWSLLLNDDLSVSPDADHPDNSSRNLDRVGDYGANYSATVEQIIATTNVAYDHSQHWSTQDTQRFISYSSTQMPAGLSDTITFKSQGSSHTSGPAAQKAYQSLVRNCFNCHNSFTGKDGEGIEDSKFGLPLEKRFTGTTTMRNPASRFIIRSHVASKDATAYSKYSWQSHLTQSMRETLKSARYRIDFDNIDQSELLVYALGKDPQGNPLTEATHHVKHSAILTDTDPDFMALKNWIAGGDAWLGITNASPEVSYAGGDTITIEEYADPAYLPDLIEWTDPDGVNELSQAFIAAGVGSHSFQDSMLALEYQDFLSAKLETYAILGDRGNQTFQFKMTDGEEHNGQAINVNVTSTYTVPRPSTILPSAYAFYTTRDTGELHKLEHDAANPATPKDTLIGTIDGYSAAWTTVYRRPRDAENGWLYFVDQTTQQIHVVDETTAEVQFHIQLNHEPNKEGDSHKQTSYLLWWRAKEGLDHMSADCPNGELQGLLESKLSDNKSKNGDWYLGLGCGDLPAEGIGSTITVVPEYRTQLKDGSNTLSVYAWKRATFMSKWVNDGVDRLNVINLVTGKDKALGSFDFAEKEVDGETYPANTYMNVRAVVVADDGAFYGFNKDLNQPVSIFNFDPLEGIQQTVDAPAWVQTYFDNYLNYATPFLVIEPKTP
jgi:hypothetical protein